MYKEKIDAYIDSKKDELLNDLMTLVRIDSQKGESSEGKPFGEGPARVLQEAEKLLQTYGLYVKNYNNYVVTGDLFGGERGPNFPHTPPKQQQKTTQQTNKNKTKSNINFLPTYFFTITYMF